MLKQNFYDKHYTGCSCEWVVSIVISSYCKCKGLLSYNIMHNLGLNICKEYFSSILQTFISNFTLKYKTLQNVNMERCIIRYLMNQLTQKPNKRNWMLNTAAAVYKNQNKRSKANIEILSSSFI